MDYHQNHKKISVALATFNGEQYLREQLESLYNQTYLPYEVVVCDDGSTDGTIAILEEYARARDLKYQVNPRNLGYIKNFEKVLTLCSGEYIALCDQDDRWMPDKLQQLIEGIGNHSLICSDAVLIDSRGNSIAGSFRKYRRVHIPRRKKQTRSLIFDNYVIGCASLFRRNDFSSNLFPLPDGIPHDWWIGIHASMKNGIKFIEKPLIEHRLHGKNIIGVPGKSLLTDLRTYRENHRTGQIKLVTVVTLKWSLRILDELEKRGLVDPWMIALKHDLRILLNDYSNSHYHPKADLYILKYLNYFCPSPNPLAKIMFLLEKL